VPEKSNISTTLSKSEASTKHVYSFETGEGEGVLDETHSNSKISNSKSSHQPITISIGFGSTLDKIYGIFNQKWLDYTEYD